MFAEALLFKGTPSYPVSATALKASLVASLNGPHYRHSRAAPDICPDILATLSIRLHQRMTEIDPPWPTPAIEWCAFSPQQDDSGVVVLDVPKR